MQKIIILTGSNSGIGFEATKALARQGHTIVMGCRDLHKAQLAKDMILQEIPNAKLDILELDQASFSSVQNFVKAFKARYDRLDVLINNAGGVFMERGETIDGIESTMQVNHLSPLLLTESLLPMLIASKGRVVNVSSDSHFRENLSVEDFQNKNKYFVMNAYGNSKLAMLFATQQLAQQYQGKVQFYALHPGTIATNIWPTHRWYFKLITPLFKRFLKDATSGAQTTIYLASDDYISEPSGTYFVNSRKARTSSRSKIKSLEEAVMSHSHQIIAPYLQE